LTDIYDVEFLNQYVKIPKNISEALDAKYAGEYESVRHCLGLVIVNLLEFGQIAYSRTKKFYTEHHTQYYTYANVLHALEIALADGYAVELQRGYRSAGYKRGWSSTLTAGPRLAEFSMTDKLELDVESLPLLSVDDKPVYSKQDLELVRERNDTILRSRYKISFDEALTLNRDYWNKMVIDSRQTETKQKCFNRVGLTRIYKSGLMGRWFQRGKMSFQQLSEGEREKLLLNGENVAEIDYSAMHPHILYAWEYKQCPKDFYESVMNQCGCTRFVAKNIVLIAINADSYAKTSRAVNNNSWEEMRANRKRAIPESVLYDELKKTNLKPKDVVEAIREAHPSIAKYIYSASANKLMLAESDIMTDVLFRLMQLDIAALPVHDSVIVPHWHEDVARDIMQKTYHEHTDFDIIIK